MLDGTPDKGSCECTDDNCYLSDKYLGKLLDISKELRDMIDLWRDACNYSKNLERQIVEERRSRQKIEKDFIEKVLFLEKQIGNNTTNGD